MAERRPAARTRSKAAKPEVVPAGPQTVPVPLPVDPEPESGTGAVEELIHAQLQELRAQVPGVLACLVASSDGLLIAEQSGELEPTRMAALTATMTALAAQAVQATRRGDLLDAVVRGTMGNLAVFAIGPNAVLAVVSDSDVTVAWLHVKTRPVVEQLLLISDRFDRFFTP